MKPPKKLTLDEAVAQTDADLHNSNVTNAAHALVALDRYRKRLDAAEKKLRKLVSDPATPFEEFKKSYDELMKLVDKV